MEKQMDTSSIMHTLALQDRNAKRTREEGSFSNKDTTDERFEIMYRKKPKLNPVNEQEEQEEAIEIVNTLQIMNIDTSVRENITPLVSKGTHHPSTSNIRVFKNSLA